MSGVELLLAGSRTDDEWENYIREASVESAILDRGRRWLEFYESCQSNHGKQGGSSFREFATSRFGFSPAVASMWVSIGRGETELFDIVKKFSPDYRAMYDFLRLEDGHKRLLIESDDLISRKTIKAVKPHARKIEREASIDDIRAAASVDVDAVCDLRVCSMQELLASVKPDAIITDPPYPREFIPLYGQMAELAKDVPLVAVMCGQSYLPQILADMARHMKYRWTLAYLTPGGQAVQQWESKVNTFWKPVVLFGDGDWIGDVVKSDTNDNDKRFHHWGQSVSGMADLVSRLVKPGQLVCDPFLGAGTTAVAALMSGCRFVGCDIDAAHVETSRERARQCLM